jgi:hypothetical protein
MQRVEICQTNLNRIQPNQTARATKTQSQSQGLKQGKQKSKKGTRVLYRQIRKKKEKKKKAARIRSGQTEHEPSCRNGGLELDASHCACDMQAEILQ